MALVNVIQKEGNDTDFLEFESADIITLAYISNGSTLSVVAIFCRGIILGVELV